MAQNPIPDSYAGITTLGDRMVAGLVAYATLLGITQISATTFQFLLDDFTSSESSFTGGRTALNTASSTLRGALATQRTWLLTARRVLVGALGERYNAQWTQAGFINNTTAIPSTQDGQIALTLALKNFFAANPSFQNTELQVTAARGQTLRAATLAALTARDAAKTTAGDLETARNTSRATLVKQMRDLIKILTTALTRDDSRWSSFGLTAPATNTTPPQPTGLAAMLDGEDNIQLTCDETPLATRYRWRMRVPGTEARYVLVTSTTAPLALVTGLLPGDTVEFIVQAVNNGSQSIASEPLLFTLPPEAAPTEPATAAEAPAPRPGPRHLRMPARPIAGNGKPARVR